MTKLFIKNIKFNDGTNLKLNENDIVIFVGTNNVGKSTTLRCISRMIAEEGPTRTIYELKEEIVDANKWGEFKKEYLNLKNEKQKNIFAYKIDRHNFELEPYTDECFDVFVDQTNTEARLTECCSCERVFPGGYKKIELIQGFIDDPKTKELVSKYYKKSFGKGLIFDFFNQEKIVVRLGEEPNISQGRADEITKEIGIKYSNMPLMSSQGDGMKSYASILMHLVFPRFSIHIIDEPELFLHQPQAYNLGNAISELSQGKQVFIATHSIEIMKGILDANPNRVKIIKVEKGVTKDHYIYNPMYVLNNNNIIDLLEDPMLKHSNILEGIFHKRIILCESESDCDFYKNLLSHELKKRNLYMEDFFALGHGKQKIHKIIAALKTLDLDVACILDIDIFDDETNFKNLLTAYGIKWSKFKHDFTILNNSIRCKNAGNVKLNDFENSVSNILSHNKGKFVTSETKNNIVSICGKTNPWKLIKQGGINSVPKGEPTIAMENMINELGKYGIHIVPVGELECFIPTINLHGPSWTLEVFEKYPNLDNPIYDKAKEFLKPLLN